MLDNEQNNPNIDLEKTNIDIKRDDSKKLSLLKRISLFLTGTAGFYVISIIVVLILSALMDTKTPEGKGAIQFVLYGVLFLILLAIVNKDVLLFKEDFKNWIAYPLGVAFGIGMILFPILYNLLVKQFYPIGIGDNETALRSFIGAYPALSIIFLGFIGPACEELTYRAGLFNLLKRYKVLAYIVASLIFAFMHFNFTSQDIVGEFIILPQYIVAGVILAVAYDKFGFAASLTAHTINNLYAVIVYLTLSNL